MSEERVIVETSDTGVVTARMVRGDKHNALDADMFRGLMAAAEEIGRNPKARAVVLHGEGPSFCSGLDIASFMGGSDMGFDDILAREEGRLANWAQRAAYDWAELAVPVISAIHGNCFGGGLQIALCTDIRIAAPDAKLCVLEIKWGLIPDMGITQSLPRLVGIDVAKEITFTGRRMSGEEADTLGLVTRVAADPLAAALALAEEIATKSPDAIRLGKRLYDEAWLASPADGLVLETELQRRVLGSQNQMLAVQAGMTKEPVTFLDPVVQENAAV